jgi:hypothetical protein
MSQNVCSCFRGSADPPPPFHHTQRMTSHVLIRSRQRARDPGPGALTARATSEAASLFPLGSLEAAERTQFTAGSWPQGNLSMEPGQAHRGYSGPSLSYNRYYFPLCTNTQEHYYGTLYVLSKCPS